MSELSELDYENIENAVMETARGRWFLNEYKKRHALADTSTLLEAIGKLEKVITSMTLEAKAGPAFIAPQPVVKPEQDLEPAPEPVQMISEPDIEVASEELSDENLAFFDDDIDIFEDEAPKLETPVGDAAPQLEIPTGNADFLASDTPDSPPTLVVPEAIAETSEDTKPVEKDKSASTEPVTKAETDNKEPSVKPPEDDQPRFKVFKNTGDRDKLEPPLTRGSFNAPKNDPAEENTIKEEQSEPETTPIEAAVPDPELLATDDEKDRIVIIRRSAGKAPKIPLADEAEHTGNSATH